MMSKEEFAERQYQVFESAKLKDRANKWAMAMMMTEHVDLIKKEIEQQKYIEKPLLEVWELQGIQEDLETSIQTKCDTDIKIWKNGKFEVYRGVINKVNENKRQIYYSDPFNKPCGPINLDDIVDIEPVEYIEF
ncbi:YolD-like family protein [Viridibacillus arvi]|uniref:YolD-like family protein n=1 Tax=Viridibacillus arvi TaxID=263475 RepID=UPI003CFFA819